MLKVSILLGLALGFTAGHHLTGMHQESLHHQRLLNVTDLIRSNGYPVKSYTVETVDGYLLDLIRIPRGIRDSQYQNTHQNQHFQSENSQSQFSSESSQSSLESSQQHHSRKHQLQHQSSGENSQSESSNSVEENIRRRPAVLLMHGLLSTAEDFVLGGPTEGLGYILADSGYDVFLGNVRGNTYGRRHTVLNPERDAAFWRFCWDDMGMKDLPAIIDTVLEVTGQRKLRYIGHMQGSTLFYVMASEKPEYNEKIHSMISLGPLAFMGRSTNIMMKLVSENMQHEGWVIQNLGKNEFHPSQELITQGGESDCLRKSNEKICLNVFFLLNGYNSRHLNTTTMMSVLNRVPSGASTRQLLHFGQLLSTGRFEKLRIDNKQTVEYNLARITTPIVLLSTPNDMLSTMEDVEKLSRKLPNLKQWIKLEELSNNLDLLYSDRVTDRVYRMLLRLLRNINDHVANNY